MEDTETKKHQRPPLPHTHTQVGVSPIAGLALKGRSHSSHKGMFLSGLAAGIDTGGDSSARFSSMILALAFFLRQISSDQHNGSIEVAQVSEPCLMESPLAMLGARVPSILSVDALVAMLPPRFAIHWEEPSMDQYQCRGKLWKNFQDHWSIRISPGKGMDQ